MTKLHVQPEGSSILLREQLGQTTLSWNPGRAVAQRRWFIVAFICFWLIAWAVGEWMEFFKLKELIAKAFTSSWTATPWGRFYLSWHGWEAGASADGW